MSDSDTPPPASNRRSGDRYVACALASLERPDGEQRSALIHDLSESGALLLVRTTHVSVDDQVIVHLPVNEAGQIPRVLHGVVVRVEELKPGEAGPWLRRVAVRFHEPLHMYAAEIEGFRRRAERLGIAQN
jgi:hypothetical protein